MFPNSLIYHSMFQDKVGKNLFKYMSVQISLTLVTFYLLESCFVIMHSRKRMLGAYRFQSSLTHSTSYGKCISFPLMYYAYILFHRQVKTWSWEILFLVFWQNKLQNFMFFNFNPFKPISPLGISPWSKHTGFRDLN